MLPPTAQHWWASTPTVTRGVLGTLVVLFVLTGAGSHAPCFDPLFLGGSVWGFALGPLCHAGFLHIIFNVWAGWTQLMSVEKAVGSSGALVLTAALAYGTELLMIPAAMAEAAVLPASLTHHTCVLGFSGALFGLLAIECFGLNPNASFSLFGCISVPARWTPLAPLASPWAPPRAPHPQEPREPRVLLELPELAVVAGSSAAH